MAAGWWGSFAKNINVSKAVAHGKTWAYSPSGRAAVSRMATGAMLGSVYGVADNLFNDKVSVIGGATQGAFYGALTYGMGAGMGALRRRR